MCEDELRKAGYMPDSPSPVRIDRFVEKHYAPIDYVDLPEGVLGCTEFANTGKVVRVVIASALDSQVTHVERRLRSTIAHEAGHCILHPSLFIKDTLQSTFKNENTEFVKEMKFMCRDTDIKPEAERTKGGYDGRWWEYQANRAIGGFLLPKKLVEVAVAPFVTKTSLGTAGVLDDSRRREAVCMLAETFEVNPKAAEIRLSEMYPAGDRQLTL